MSANVNGGNIAIDGGASLTINHSLTNGSPSSASGLIQLHNGGALTINGNLTNWDQIPTGFSEDGPGGNNTLDVTGEVINNFRSGPVQDFVELEGSGDVLKAGLFQNSATVRIGQGAKITVGGSYTQTGGETDVAGTLMSPAITVMGGTLASGGGIVEMKTLTSGALITTDSTGFIGAGTGTFTATRGYQQVANGTLDELISSKSAFGVIDVTGPASLNGTLDVVLQNGFVPTVGEQFAFLNFTKGDLTGTFADFLGQTFDKEQEDWDITYNNAIGEVLLTAGSTAPCNAVLAVGASSSDCGPSPTPEPASLLLLGTGLLGLGLGLRKKTGAAPAVRNPSRWQARRIAS